MNRRGFLSGILASGFAPAIGHAGILMPVKTLKTEIPGWFYDADIGVFIRHDAINNLFVVTNPLTGARFAGKPASFIEFSHHLPSVPSMSEKCRAFL